MSEDSRTLWVWKAQPLGEGSQVPDLVLLAQDEMPVLGSLQESREVYEDEAETIECALNRCLPGGTYHALLVCMLRRKESLLVVPNEAR